MTWTDEEAQAFAARLIGRSEADVRADAAEAGVDLRVVHVHRAEWHTDSFLRHGVTVRFDAGIAVSAHPG
jgi:hypothetical protein